MTKTKNQHFVPQFYLRNFSFTKRDVSIYIKAKDKCIESAPISGQCSKDYYYDNDGVFESNLSKLEGSFAPLLKSIDTDDDINTKEIVHRFLHFAALQFSRTPASIGIFCRTFGVKLEISPAVLVKAYHLLLPLMSSLHIQKIRNISSNNFITSDNPVIAINPLFKNSLECIKFNATGIMLLIPISPKTVMMIYDKQVYGALDNWSNNSNVTKLQSDTVVDYINALSMQNADKLSIFRCDTDLRYLRHLQKMIDSENATRKIGTNSENRDKSLSLKFSKGFYIPKKIQRKKLNVDIDPMLTSIHQGFVEKVLNGELKFSEWNTYVQDQLLQIAYK